MDNSAKTDLADKLKSANNILVTVSRNPSVDQLAACIGLTLLLNKLGKHAAAIFSGEVPSTLEFLQPEETLEKNTDSLRDFIIALDKSKADKLRYKVEDNVVRIFITPYRTSISQNDLEFSQGDFNVDVVVALGVRQQEDLDNAITVHGRILHDAVVASVNTSADGGLGSIAWHDPQASSLSELVTDLALVIGDDMLDSQIATALLTGVVSATDRFSNEKTTSQTMNVSARLMAAGANQQLVASKLEATGTGRPSADTPEPAAAAPEESSRSNDGTLEIRHDAELPPELSEPTRPSGQPFPQQPQFPPESAYVPEPSLPPAPVGPKIHDTHSEAGDLAPHHDNLPPDFELPKPQFSPPPPQFPSEPAMYAGPVTGNSIGGMMTAPPSLGGMLTANTEPEDLDPATDPLSAPSQHGGQLLSHDDPSSARSLFTPPPSTPFTPPVTHTAQPDNQTLADLEKSVNSPHVNSPASTGLGDARDAVSQALVSNSVARPEPIQALGARPLGEPLQHDAGPVLTPAAPAGLDPGQPAVIMPSNGDGTTPPPVPPPIPFQFSAPPTPPQGNGPTMPL